MMQNDPNYVCPNCAHGGDGTSAWPCRCCSRINQFRDYYEPADGSEAPKPKNMEAFLCEEVTSAESLAKMVFGKFNIRCGSCPAAITCMKLVPEQPKEGSDDCLYAFRNWLEQEAGT